MSKPLVSVVTITYKKLAADQRFVLAIGNPKGREKLYRLFRDNGFKAMNFIGTNSLISTVSSLGNGLNLMPFCLIYSDTIIGDGRLTNSYASVNHDSELGQFVTVSLGARVLGRVQIGDFVEIGSNSVILTDIKTGNNVVIGAGSIVTKDIPNIAIAIGAPVKVIRYIDSIDNFNQ